MSRDPRVSGIRSFNRTVTERIGALQERYLARDRPLGVDRVLWEIGPEGAEVRDLRTRLNLDSGYLSRVLRTLEAAGLARVDASTTDTRVRRVALTAAGLDERAVLDSRSDELVETILAPLTTRQRDELAAATATVERLLTAGAVEITPVDPADPQALVTVEAYYDTLRRRFPEGFDPGRSRTPEADALRAPHGTFLLATLRARPVGCVSVRVHEEDGRRWGEIKRLWVAPETRGMGMGRRLLTAIEDAAQALGATSVRLDTNRALTEAIAMYRSSGYREIEPYNDERYAHHWFGKSLEETAPAPVGFIGTGIMGTPMARRLLRAGTPLTVWSRRPEASAPLALEGAEVAGEVAEVFARCETVLVMLRNAAAVDAVLRKHPAGLRALVAGRTVVNLGTLAPAYSATLAAEVREVGGEYVEAPVSGSRVPAETGALVAMLAGTPQAMQRVTPLLEPLCASITECGQIPAALTAKLTANVFLIALATGLAEAFHFGDRHGLDRELLRGILDAGQMASPISRVKSAKFVAHDETAQAAVSDVLANAELILDAADGTAVPLIERCRTLYRDAVAHGDGDADLIAVIRAIARADDKA